ncbi:hypothetical protein [Kitasatospora sp. McL0602]|uniref:hypothetical protein n=1 Tax=Kitasatospora sp. McL0602 TaxID=3439530 RepID=UPI003F888A89
MSTTPTPPPTVNGQVIGQAHYATRALMERLLLPVGITFQQSVALNATVDAAVGAGDSVDRDRITARMTGALKVDVSAALATVAELTAAGLLETLPGDLPRLRATEAGRALTRELRAEVAELTARLYGDFSAEELAVAGMVLATVTARADAELADAELVEI